MLDEITLAVTMSNRTFSYSAAGHQETSSASDNTVGFAYDQEGRLELASRTGGDTCPFEYDGRSYLRQAGDLATTGTVQPTYDSAGLLYVLLRQEAAASTPVRYHLLYVAGRAVAQLATESGQPDRWWYLTTDHLGTPVVAADDQGDELWEAAFEPFGRDAAADTGAGALAGGIFLRFPGQWEDEVWGSPTLGVDAFYNVHRWYEPLIGRYSRPDPLGLAAGVNQLVYVDNEPIRVADPTGLQGGFVTRQELEDAAERGCAQGAFVRNFNAMREANWIGADTYFHCKANCEATQCGQAGQEYACLLSDLREKSDQIFKGDPPSASRIDQQANKFGRQQGEANPKKSCVLLCARHRPKGLPAKY